VRKKKKGVEKVGFTNGVGACNAGERAKIQLIVEQTFKTVYLYPCDHGGNGLKSCNIPRYFFEDDVASGHECIGEQAVVGIDHMLACLRFHCGKEGMKTSKDH